MCNIEIMYDGNYLLGSIGRVIASKFRCVELYRYSTCYTGNPTDTRGLSPMNWGGPIYSHRWTCGVHGSGDFWAQPPKIRPFTTSTGFLRIWPVANLLPFIWTGQYPIFFSKFWLIPSFIVMTTGQELGHRYVSRFSNVAKLWNAIMKQKLRMFAIHQIVTSLQRTKLKPRTRWYPALDESNRMKFGYFTIDPGKNPPPQNGCRLKSVLFLKAPVWHPPLSQFNRTFHKTNRPPLH